jgi:hypothetical protein
VSFLGRSVLKIFRTTGVHASAVVVLPYHRLSSPIVISSWEFQLQVSSPSDPRLQQFVDKFRASPTFRPEYGGECTGGVGNPSRRDTYQPVGLKAGVSADRADGAGRKTSRYRCAAVASGWERCHPAGRGWRRGVRARRQS